MELLVQMDLMEVGISVGWNDQEAKGQLMTPEMTPACTSVQVLDTLDTASTQLPTQLMTPKVTPACIRDTPSGGCHSVQVMDAFLDTAGSEGSN